MTLRLAVLIIALLNVVPIETWSANLGNCRSSLKMAGFEPKAGVGHDDWWIADGPWAARRSYSIAFRDLLSPAFSEIKSDDGHFQTFLSLRRKEGKTTHALDLMGSGFFIENEETVDSVTGLRWGPYAKDELIGHPEIKVPTQVLGDIFNGVTWEKLDVSMKERSITSMDLIVLNPAGGWLSLNFSTAEENTEALTYIVEKVLSRISADGRFYFNLPLPEGLLTSLKFDNLKKLVEAGGMHKIIFFRRSDVKNPRIQGAILPSSH